MMRPPIGQYLRAELPFHDRLEGWSTEAIWKAAELWSGSCQTGSWTTSWRVASLGPFPRRKGGGSPERPWPDTSAAGTSLAASCRRGPSRLPEA